MEAAPTAPLARAKGRRVSRACLSCRVRKMRCDLCVCRRRRIRRRPRRRRHRSRHRRCRPSSPSSPPPSAVSSTSDPFARQPRALPGHFASADIVNPSDALVLLAQVADLDPAGCASSASRDAAAVAEAVVTWPEVAFLARYHEKFHPFFPVVCNSVFDGRPVSELGAAEPHLLAAILTVASKDDGAWARVHEACSRHIEAVLSTLLCAASTAIGSVEALLILAEWALQRPRGGSAVGCGQEDPGAWMFVGMAIRLGYLLCLEQTGLAPEGMVTSVADLRRRRVVWAACYMCYRQVSIRLGKGFWSRGPIPSISWRAADFPTLERQALGPDNLALMFQAQLELIQLFSNAHDILYSSSTHREQLYTGGQYIRYIDDFAALLRKWKTTWSTYTFTPPVKTSLAMSSEFLRIYINSFAFQAALNRAVDRRRAAKVQARGPLFNDVGSDPDARFIYESIDAASSLLTTFNGDGLDSVAGLECMPIKYCLYVIYAAVFLFKARLTGATPSTAPSPSCKGRRLTRTASAAATPRRCACCAASSRPRRGRLRPAPGGESAVGTIDEFSWRDLDSLGTYLGDDPAHVPDDPAIDALADRPVTTLEVDWDHGPDLDALLPYLDVAWSGQDVIF